MVKILKNGYKKTFIQKCSECSTDFIYQRFDVKTRKGYSEQLSYYIQCPECHATLRATFNEYNENDEMDEE